MLPCAPRVLISVVFFIAPAVQLQAGGLSPFSEEAAARGIVYTMQSPPTDGYLGFGCGLFDLDGDHDIDAVIVGADDGRVGVFENLGLGMFADRSLDTGIPLLGAASGLAAADYDGDGLIDLYLTQYEAANVLLRNLGGLTFENVSAAAGVADPANSKGAAFGDLDGDGLLDLYVANYTGKGAGDNRLYHNQGDGTFVDIAVAQGVDDAGDSFQPVWFDFDLDGDLDLYLSNDRGHLTGLPNQLWRNDDGTLVNISAASNADDGFFSMGLAVGDIDLNGYADLYCTNISTQTFDDVGGVFPLYLNQGDGTFIESAVSAGVDALGVGVGWGGVFFDYDNDALLDLYVNIQFAPNRLFTGAASFPMTEMAAALNCGGSTGQSFSTAVGDIDGDGDLDMLVNNLSGPVQLFVNQEGQKRNWLRLRMVGTGKNTSAIGGRAEVRLGSDLYTREVYSGGNTYLGQNELVMHFGLGAASAADEILATWPDGASRMLSNLPANRTWILYAPQDLGDTDGNGVVEAADFPQLVACLDQTFIPGCGIMDFDGDSDVDGDDFAAFLAAHEGPLPDCNGNRVNDYADILNDPALDVDEDGVIDTCTTCAVFADCADLDDDDVRDDGCVWWSCAGGVCVGTDVVFADMGGQFGLCAPDGAADGNDRFHALNCFANADPDGSMGDTYGCEADAPAAFNVDAGGQFGDCSPDGVCDGNDAFHALNSFAGASSCTCPLGGPAPGSPAPIVTEGAAVELRTTTPQVTPGQRFEVDVLLRHPLGDLRGYQLHLDASGGRLGSLELVDVSVTPRAPVRRLSHVSGHVFGTRPYWDAYNLATRQVVVGLDSAGGATTGTYLATFVFRASADAAGTFVIDLLHDAGPHHRTFLFPTPAHGRILLAPTAPLAIRVGH